jgi:phosphatidylglycerophosphatase A
LKRAPSIPAPLGERLLASFLLIGEAAPFAPATFASLALLPVIHLYCGWSLPVQVAVLAATTFVGTWVSSRAERWYGEDGSAIVIDEVAGMFVTFLGVALPGTLTERLVVLGAGFLLFRIFDIVKPFPAGRAQDLHGGVGVMTDDLIAGLYANLALRAGLHLWGG